VDIRLPFEFEARWYQAQAMAYFDAGGKRAVHVWSRRAGKDITFMHQIAKMAHERVGTYFHMLPTFTQAKRNVWDAIDDQGRRMIDQAFPKAIRANKNETDLKIDFRCGSAYQLIGADSYNLVVGSNPVGILMSEYALIDPRAWQHFRPILMQNGGWAVFVGTPRGYNHFHEMLKIAQGERAWDWSVVDAIEAGTMTQEDIDAEIRTGMPEEMARQEYLVDFSAANVGAILGNRIERAEREGRISDEVEFDADGPGVVVSSDIGYRDTAAWWFWQAARGGFKLLAYDEDVGLDAGDWIERLKDQPLKISKVLLPHDARAKTFTSKHSVLEQFLRSGFECAIVPQTRIVDRINAARSVIHKCKFAKTACAKGLQMLRDWSFKFDEEKKIFSREPDHNYASHGGDAFSYGCQSLEEFLSTANPDDPYRDIGHSMNHAWTLEQLYADREATQGHRHF
jgi:phage terminase large subunit